MKSEFCQVILFDTTIYLLTSNKVRYQLAWVNPDKPILAVQFDRG